MDEVIEGILFPEKITALCFENDGLVNKFKGFYCPCCDRHYPFFMYINGTKKCLNCNGSMGGMSKLTNSGYRWVQLSDR